jgi:hypothetical protein
MQISELIPILQTAVGPVILISGVGLLLLSLTNRFGRVTDRSRQTIEALRSADLSEKERLVSQLRIFSHRGRIIQVSISFAVLSILLAAILVIAIFLAAVVRVEAGMILIVLFIACMASLIASLILFLRDINASLAALQLEVDSARNHQSESKP